MCPCTRADVPDALSSGMSGDVVEIVRAAMLTCGWCGGFACTGSHGCQAPHVLLALGVQGSICEGAAAVHVLLRLHTARPDLWFAVCLLCQARGIGLGFDLKRANFTVRQATHVLDTVRRRWRGGGAERIGATLSVDARVLMSVEVCGWCALPG